MVSIEDGILEKYPEVQIGYLVARVSAEPHPWMNPVALRQNLVKKAIPL